MDFFDRQDRARRNTKLLVLFFALAVLGIIGGVYLACVLIFTGLTGPEVGLDGQARNPFWHPDIFVAATLGTLIIITGGSLYRTASLAAGGRAVAESLGGRLIDPNTRDLQERKLLNVVEEMALASGLPVPQVYVLDQEPGINAFAAGHSPTDAAIGVTRGCMTLLTRDELQGVIGHEFSHILNGDMRLNLRLMGIIFGILCLTVIGRALLRTRGRRNPLPLLGLALILIGWVGVFFGRLIQAAVSRQREFLADAASVQFTRNPQGLSGALQKIGGLIYGSTVQAEHAAEASHLFFGEALKPSFLNAFATHPPLEERIRAIDPTWDGRFPKVSVPALPELVEAPPRRPRVEPQPPVILPPSPKPTPAAAAVAPRAIPAQAVLPTLGQPTPLHLRYAEALRDALPNSLQAAAREPVGAMALINALLLSKQPALRQQQLDYIQNQAGPDVHAKTLDLAPLVERVATRARLPLVDLALPALRRLSPAQFALFSRTLVWLVESDRQIELFEYVLQRAVRRHLEPYFVKRRPTVAQYYALRPLLPDCAVLLSALAYVGSAQAGQAQRAFNAGAPYLRSTEPVRLLPPEQCGLAHIDQALQRLAVAAPQIKRNLLEACIHVVGADGLIQEAEAELLRAIADSLDCPIPPFVESAPAADPQTV